MRRERDWRDLDVRWVDGLSDGWRLRLGLSGWVGRELWIFVLVVSGLFCKGGGRRGVFGLGD